MHAALDPLAGIRGLRLPENTPAARWAATNAPSWALPCSFQSYPAARVGRAAAEVAVWLARWADKPREDLVGVVLWGTPGLGKTGLACAALRVIAERGDGDEALWNMVTSPGVRAAQAQGTLRWRPAPAWFESWSMLRRRYERARRGLLIEAGEPVAAAELLEELDRRVDCLVLDDLDVDAFSPAKEDLMLTLVDRVMRRRRLILTLNGDPGGKAGAKLLGDRIADRLHDNRTWTILGLRGTSLRRR